VRTLLLSILLVPASAAEPVPPSADSVGIPVSIHKGYTELSTSLKKALRRAHREVGTTELGRYLLTMTVEVPIVERIRLSGTPIRTVGGVQPVIEVDKERVPDLPLTDFESLLFEARWKALARMPIELRDTEMAARQNILDHFIQKAASEPGFTALLRTETAKWRELLESRRELQKAAERGGETEPILFPGAAPRSALARTAFDLYLFSEDPQFFYMKAVETARLSDEAVGFTELEDFLALNGGKLDRVRFQAGGRQALIDGRSYSGALVRAALQVKDREGLERIRERLGPFRTVAQQELRQRVNSWLRSVP